MGKTRGMERQVSVLMNRLPGRESHTKVSLSHSSPPPRVWRRRNPGIKSMNMDKIWINWMKMDKTARAWCSRRPRPRPSRRLVRTEMVALWSRKQESDGNHILTKTELSAQCKLPIYTSACEISSTNALKCERS